MPSAVSRKSPLPNRAQADGVPLDVRLPARIEAMRTRLGVPAAQVDRMSGFRPGTLRRLELGRQRLYANHLFHIAAALGVEVGWFFEDAGEALSARTSEALEMRRLVNVLLRIDDDRLKRDISELIEILAEKTSE